MKCHRCRNRAEPGYVHCLLCLTYRRAYFRAYRGSRRVTQEARALAWLQAGPKTTREIYTLINGASMQATWQTLKRLKEKGKATCAGRRWEAV